jgi:hypothetical protein
MIQHPVEGSRLFTRYLPLIDTLSLMCNKEVPHRFQPPNRLQKPITASPGTRLNSAALFVIRGAPDQLHGLP